MLVFVEFLFSGERGTVRSWLHSGKGVFLEANKPEMLLPKFPKSPHSLVLHTCLLLTASLSVENTFDSKSSVTLIFSKPSFNDGS